MITEVYGQYYECDLSREHIATIIRLDPPSAAGAEFYTEKDRPLQVGRLWYRAGHRVRAHRHITYDRPSYKGQSQEVLVVKKGAMVCHFYDYRGRWAGDFTARAGDVLVIHSGGHGFDVQEDTEIIEVKQGPYRPDDKEFLGGEVAPGAEAEVWGNGVAQQVQGGVVADEVPRV